MKHDLTTIVEHFEIPGTFLAARPYGSGHINDTYLVTMQSEGREVPWIIQRINHEIFTDVPGLMENICRVTEHVRRRLAAEGGHDVERETLTVIPATDGKPFYQDADGQYWRTYVFLTGARTYDEVRDGRMAREAARAFGTFQNLLMDLPAPPLHETIPFFHHTPTRFGHLEQAIRADAKNRAATCSPDIEFALARKNMTTVLTERIETGELPLRVTHNDTKINNVMIDDQEGTGICVIDLDTVMPGTVLYDFGDQIRTTTGTAAEDEQDLAKVRFQLDMFEELVRGYTETTRDFLLPAERQYLAFSGRLITFEIGIRFLTDYLSGDVYFKTHRPGHNLDRARTQFEMVRQMECQEEAMENIVAAFHG